MQFLFPILSLSEYVPTDPLFNKQFGLKNTGQFNGIADEDLRLERTWNSGYFGSNIPVAIISDGCYYEHADLKGNFDLEHSWNYFTWENSPNHLNISDKHRGTDFAGIISASGNEICTIGVAPHSKFSCFNIENENRTNENIIDSINRHNDYFRVKLLGRLERCDKICRHVPFNKGVHEALTKAPETVNFVTPAGADAFLGADPNFFPLSRDPRVIVVSDSNHRGVHSSWSNKGTSVMANAPAGGSSSFDYITFPSMPGIGVESNTSCKEEVNPVGAGAAYATGAIALALEANPKLTWRDIQALIAVTSSINNPEHYTWTTNGAGYKYSKLYGFGRINSNLLVSTARNWNLLPQQSSFKATVTNETEIPTLNNGGVDIQFNIDGSIPFVEYVTLSVAAQVIDVSLLRFQLKSPKGTMYNVKETSISNDDNHTVNLLYTVRGFFGENPEGVWKLHIVSDSIGPVSTLFNSTLTIYGTSKVPSLPHVPRIVGKNPYTPLTKEASAEINIENELVACRSDFTLNITGKQNVDTVASMYLSTIDRKQRWPLEEEIKITNETLSINMSLPCYFSDKGELNLIVEDMKTGVWGETKVSIENTEKDLILLNPTRYQVFRCKSEDPKNVETDIVINPAMQMKYWIDGSYGQRARVSILDMDSGDFVFRKDVDMDSEISIHYNGTACPRCLLSVVPSWHDVMHDCLTMLQPISIISHHDNPPPKWIIPLTDNCPIPPGIFTPTPIPTPSRSPTPLPTPTFDDSNGKPQNKAAILTGSIFIGVYAVCLGVFMCISGKRRVNASIEPLLSDPTLN